MIHPLLIAPITLVAFVLQRRHHIAPGPEKSSTIRIAACSVGAAAAGCRACHGNDNSTAGSIPLAVTGGKSPEENNVGTTSADAAAW